MQVLQRLASAIRRKLPPSDAGGGGVLLRLIVELPDGRIERTTEPLPPHLQAEAERLGVGTRVLTVTPTNPIEVYAQARMLARCLELRQQYHVAEVVVHVRNDLT